ncbi:MAG: hypothetical protein R3C01_09610 [Planctomycetaceae bacterium]
MNLITYNIPADHADWPHWLERQLVGSQLGELIVELETLRGENNNSDQTLDDLCGSQLDQIMTLGLSVLSETQIRSLLKQPALLLSLQEMVFVNGGHYWSQVERAGNVQDETTASWNRVATTCELDTPSNVAPTSTRTFQPSIHLGRRQWLTRMGTVAALVVVGLGFWFSRPSGPTWGFDRGDLLTADVSAADYLNSLADASDDWFQKRPQQAQAVSQRISEFEHGCETLIAAPHTQLNDVDRQWLIEKCQLWKSKLTAHRTDLESKRTTPDQARDAVDETVRSLQLALRQRAAEIVG